MSFHYQQVLCLHKAKTLCDIGPRDKSSGNTCVCIWILLTLETLTCCVLRSNIKNTLHQKPVGHFTISLIRLASNIFSRLNTLCTNLVCIRIALLDELYPTSGYVVNLINFWQFLTADYSFTTIFFEKTHLKNGSSHLYASFGTFCV